MWAAEHQTVTSAPVETVWRRYRDVGTWPQWNQSAEAVVLDGDFVTGATGTLTPPGQQPLPFEVVEAVENTGYTSETRIADTVTLRLISRLESTPEGGARITHRAELVGPAAEHFAQSFGPVLAEGVPQTLAALAEITAHDAGAPAQRALLLLTSTSELGDTGRPTGAYMSEVAEAWSVFREAGYPVEVASVLGGRPPLEAVNEADPVQRSFLDDARMSAVMADTPRAADIDAAAFDIVFVAGGHGAVWDLPYDAGVTDVLAAAYQRGAVVAAVCHGAAALLDVTLSDGTALVAGREISAFSNDEERAVGMVAIVPYLLADALIERGARYEAAPSFMPHVVVDGRLVTGQNPASAIQVAEAAASVAASVATSGQAGADEKG